MGTKYYIKMYVYVGGQARTRGASISFVKTIQFRRYCTDSSE